MSFSPATLPSFRSQAFIALGSNLDNPAWHVQSAFREINDIPELSLVRISSLYRTAPVGIVDQPPFVNAVAMAETTLSPHTLLKHLHGIEESHGRVRYQGGERNGPRTLDLDLLMFNDWQIDDEHLTTPHPRMRERAFVLVPLVEIAPESEIPGVGRAADCLALLDARGVTRLEDAEAA
ncbi:MAG: 2-amino-4-hydroxy-6-hydroxymethyldihydropteridine diphosphokinase [Betaproteobacteria bacterium]|nr:2-amino-4-hydroxy-6-hydroxymethyldihydropteridine diphosphokinase [Betaproteobacteria bacterium]